MALILSLHHDIGYTSPSVYPHANGTIYRWAGRVSQKSPSGLQTVSGVDPCLLA